MAETPAGFSGRRTVSVSLRSHGGQRYLIADREIVFVDGVVSPLEHDGRRYVFTHRQAATWTVGSAASDEIYIFDEAEADPLN